MLKDAQNHFTLKQIHLQGLNASTVDEHNMPKTTSIDFPLTTSHFPALPHSFDYSEGDVKGCGKKSSSLTQKSGHTKLVKKMTEIALEFFLHFVKERQLVRVPVIAYGPMISVRPFP